MYLDVFDTVRTNINRLTKENCHATNAYQSESLLFYQFLRGEKVTFSLSQIIDSVVLKGIIASQNHMLINELIEKNYIGVSLFSNTKSVTSYFMKCLSYGLEDKNEIFRFSSFPMMDTYTIEEKKGLYKNILKKLSNYEFDFSMKGIDLETTNAIEESVRVFLILDQKHQFKCQKNSIPSNRFTLKKLANNFLNDIINKNEDSDEIKLSRELLCLIRNKKLDGNRRSSYYAFFDGIKGEEKYSEATIEKIRNAIDTAYNIAVAQTICPNENINLNFKKSDIHKRSTLHNLNSIQESKVRMDIIKDQGIKTVEWNNLMDILPELESIRKEYPKLNNEMVFKKYIMKESFGATLDIGKFILSSCIEKFIPDLGNIALNVIMDETKSQVDDIIKLPSRKEVIESMKQKSKNIAYVKKTLNYISVTCSN